MRSYATDFLEPGRDVWIEEFRVISRNLLMMWRALNVKCDFKRLLKVLKVEFGFNSSVGLDGPLELYNLDINDIFCRYRHWLMNPHSDVTTKSIFHETLISRSVNSEISRETRQTQVSN